MVRMFPSYGPVKETTSDAERKVYSALQRGLSDGYFVYHGVTWQYKDTDGRLRDGEVDFVIVHQNIGLLLLEVKGGKVECDGADDWYSVDRTGERHSIKNPFHQVRVAYHILQRHLEQTRPTSNYASEYRFATGVWFPDMRWRRGRLSHPLLRDEQVLDLADLENPIQGVRRLVRFCEPDSDRSRPLSQSAIEALREMFEPTLKWYLGDVIERDKAVFAKLTQEQHAQLDRMARKRQLVVQGSAGTGKTAIATTKARQLARSGLDVLFLCSNPFLARKIQRDVTEKTADGGHVVTVQYLDELCSVLAYQAGLPAPTQALRSDTDRARSLTQSLRILESRGALPSYDAILVDEAQDFGPSIWPHLNKLRRDRTDGLFYIFCDPAQRTDGQEWKPPSFVTREDHVLTSNCRNTQTIFNLVRRLYTGRIQPTCAGPEGQAVEFIPVRDGTAPDGQISRDIETQAVRKLLDRLIRDEHVAPDDVLIVTCHPVPNQSRWYEKDVFGTYPHTWRTDMMMSGHVRVASIRTAKGLESPVVILSELDGLSDQSNRQVLLYIATSRAMSHLIIMGTRGEVYGQ